MDKIVINGVSNRNFIEKYAYDFNYIIENKIDPNTLSERYYRKGKACWVFQTLINLNYYFGERFNVKISDVAENESINIIHYDDFSFKTKPWRGYTIVCQADRPSLNEYSSYYTVVQNPFQAESQKIYIPHWPQPNIKVRERIDNNIKTIAFFGHQNALPPFFSSENFIKELEVRHINFIHSLSDWTDYRNVDIAISFRKGNYDELIKKPSSKLINAWYAGCPFICDEEPSIKAIRKSHLDYLVAHDQEQLISTIDELQNNQLLYIDMVRNGRIRFLEFERQVTASKWNDLISSIISKKTPAHLSRFLVYSLNKINLLKK
ncbi:hypothetical protein [Xenorhabdus sp. TH1]|uniref:glycosyltransferase n=1 Tax=Xenorhabdus sp. TH1 TaxID=3130166 RepID=UPI0030D5580E